MEVPTAVAVPIIVAALHTAAQLFWKAWTFRRPKAPNGNGRITLDQALADMNSRLTSIDRRIASVESNIREIREVDIPDVGTRILQVEKAYDRLMARVYRLEQGG